MTEKQKGRQFRYYLIYGFLIAVDQAFSAPFEAEYSRFRLDTGGTHQPDLLITRANGCEALPTRQRGAKNGMLLPLGEGDTELICDDGVAADFVFSMAEPCIAWDDKCFIHAGAVSKNGRAMLFPAVMDTGKTSTVMQLLHRGYAYIGDEWVVVDTNAKAYPFPKRVHIINHNLEGDKAMVLRALNGNHAAYQLYLWYFRIWLLFKQHFPVRRVRSLLGIFRPILCCDIQALLPDVTIAQPAAISYVFYLQRANVADITIEEMDGGEVARRMASWNQFEKREFIKEYHVYAATGIKPNHRIEGMLERETGIMRAAFRNAKVFKVSLPDSMLSKETFRQLAAAIDSLFNSRCQLPASHSTAEDLRP